MTFMGQSVISLLTLRNSPASTVYSLVNDSNMQISPVYPWELEGMFNPFPWVEGFVGDEFRSTTNTPPKDWDTKDELLDGLHTFKRR